MFNLAKLRKLAKLVADYSDCSCQGRDNDNNPKHDGLACHELADELPYNKWCIGCLLDELRNEASKRK